MCVCVYVCMCVCVYVCYAYIYVCVYERMCVYVYVCFGKGRVNKKRDKLNNQTSNKHQPKFNQKSIKNRAIKHKSSTNQRQIDQTCIKNRSTYNDKNKAKQKKKNVQMARKLFPKGGSQGGPRMWFWDKLGPLGAPGGQHGSPTSTWSPPDPKPFFLLFFESIWGRFWYGF